MVQLTPLSFSHEGEKELAKWLHLGDKFVLQTVELGLLANQES